MLQNERPDQAAAGQGHNPLFIQRPGTCQCHRCLSAGLTLLVSLVLWLVGVCRSSFAHLPRNCVSNALPSPSKLVLLLAGWFGGNGLFTKIVPFPLSKHVHFV